MWGTYFNDQLKWQGQVRFDGDQGFTLIDRVSKAEEQIPVGSVVRLELLPMPAWTKLLNSNLGIFAVALVLGWILGLIIPTSLGAFWTGLCFALAMTILNFFKPVFTIGQVMHLVADGRAPVRIQMPAALLKVVRSQFPQWLA